MKQSSQYVMEAQTFSFSACMNCLGIMDIFMHNHKISESKVIEELIEKYQSTVFSN